MTTRLAVCLIVLCCAVIGSCRRGSPPTSTNSPDGSMVLLTDVNRDNSDPTRYLCVIVEIQDKAGKTLHREVTPASDTQRWTIQWISNDEILLDSSDVGPYRLLRQNDGSWRDDWE